MGSIVVDVMLKPEILDPQGQAVGGALPRLGFEGFTDVRQGKRFVLSVDGDVTDEHLAAAREAAEKLLSNPVIEDVVSVHVLDDTGDADAAALTTRTTPPPPMRLPLRPTTRPRPRVSRRPTPTERATRARTSPSEGRGRHVPRLARRP